MSLLSILVISYSRVRAVSPKPAPFTQPASVFHGAGDLPEAFLESPKSLASQRLIAEPARLSSGPELHKPRLHVGDEL